MIPAYNAETWIADTLQSAIAQTWLHKEIIVVDDGSTDGTLAVAREFESDGVQVVTQPNQGAAAARNTASSLSRGDYIQWLDADDLLSPDKVTHQMQAAEETRDRRTLFSSPWAFFRYRPAKATFIPTPLWSDRDPTEWLTSKWEGNWHMQTATWLVSKELTEAAGPWDMRLLGDDDGEYFSRVINASNGIRFVPQSRVYYRITSSSRLSHIGTSDSKIEAVKIHHLVPCSDEILETFVIVDDLAASAAHQDGCHRGRRDLHAKELVERVPKTVQYDRSYRLGMGYDCDFFAVIRLRDIMQVTHDTTLQLAHAFALRRAGVGPLRVPELPLRIVL